MINELQRRLTNDRQIRGLTQAEYADLIGVTPQSVSLWESGQRTPTPRTVKMIADATGMDYVELMQMKGRNIKGPRDYDEDIANALRKVLAEQRSESEMKRRVHAYIDRMPDDILLPLLNLLEAMNDEEEEDDEE